MGRRLDAVFEVAPHNRRMTRCLVDVGGADAAARRGRVAFDHEQVLLNDCDSPGT
jgi:hypothetical protein